MLKYGILILLLCLFIRDVFLEFGERVLGLAVADVSSTRAYVQHCAGDAMESDWLFRARVMSFAPNTWRLHSSSLRDFISFCERRELNIFDCTPYIINLFLLHLAQIGKSIGVIESFLHALTFLFKFYLIRDYATEPMVADLLRFLRKVCEKRENKKDAFGSEQIRIIWDSIDKHVGNVSSLSDLQLRSFVMAVFQHSTFCRFSDLQHITLSDVIPNVDYFTIRIRYSKTDQSGVGHTVFVPRLDSVHRNPHMLMCLYLERLDSRKIGNESLMYLFPPLR